MPPSLPIKIINEPISDTTENSIIKKNYAEILKRNTKPKENVNVNNTEDCFDKNQGISIKVENFKIDEITVTNNRKTRNKIRSEILVNQGEK